MKIEFTQGSDEWLAFRRTKRNASESPMIMRASPFGGWKEVKASKEGNGFKGNIATRHGHEHEEAARASAEFEYDTKFLPTVLFDGDYSASLDGLSSDGEIIAEIKCPFKGKESKLWKAAAKGDPIYYEWQVQHQLMVTPSAKKAVLWVYDAESGDSCSVEIFPDMLAQQQIKDQWDLFYAWMESGEADPCDGVQRRDDLWGDAVAAYKRAKAAADKAAAELELAKEELVSLVEADKESGYGCTVTKADRKGSVDYAKVPELAGVDLEQYRKKSTTVVSVTLTKE